MKDFSKPSEGLSKRPAEDGKNKELETKKTRFESSLRRFAVTPRPSTPLVTNILKQSKELAEQTINAQREALKTELEQAKASNANMPSDFADLQEEIADVLANMRFDVPEMGKDPDDNAGFLTGRGNLDLASIGQEKESLKKWLENSALSLGTETGTTVREAVSSTIGAIARYETLQTNLMLLRRPGQPITVPRREGATSAEERMAGRLALFGFAGLAGFITLAISLFSKGEKNFKAPAIYLTLAGLAAMGPGLMEKASEKMGRDLSALGSPEGPLKTVGENPLYSVRGPAWIPIIRNMKSLEFEDEKHVAVLNRMKLETPFDGNMSERKRRLEERTFIVDHLSPPDEIRPQVENLIANGQDFLKLQNFLQESRSDEAERFLVDYVQSGISKKTVDTFVKGWSKATNGAKKK
ncbi:MAG: hypothetical protein AAB489_00210 [Patescibacteria group bacterium]